MAEEREVPPTLQGKPTPTQAELDQINLGNAPDSLEPDGSPEQPPAGEPVAARRQPTKREPTVAPGQPQPPRRPPGGTPPPPPQQPPQT
jgi:hypothetical protein